jgi:DNA replication protein DnaC
MRQTVVDLRHELFHLANAAAADAHWQAAAAVGVERYRDYRLSESWRCGQCGEGWIGVGYALQPGRSGCRCMREAATGVRDAYLAEHLPARAREAWGMILIPPRFRNASLEGFERRKGATVALDRCTAYAEGFAAGQTTTGLMLVGPFGSGKTHLAIATARRVMERTFTVPAVMTADQLVRDTQEHNFDPEPARRARSVALLVLDDIAQTRPTEYRRDLLYSIIDERYQEQRPTILTSNAGDLDLTEYFGGAFTSRLSEMCAVLTLNAADYRLRRLAP